MKTFQLFVMILIAICNSAFAQEQEKVRKKKEDPVSFSKHQFDVNLGVGLNMTTIANGTKAHVFPISASMDYGIAKTVSLGFNLGYTSVAMHIPSFKRKIAEATGNLDLLKPRKQQIATIGIRLAAHYGQYEKVDFYGGPIIGMRYSLVTLAGELDSIKRVFEDPATERKVAFGGFVGIRYRFVKNMGVFVELGALHAAFQVGVNYRL